MASDHPFVPESIRADHATFNVQSPPVSARPAEWQPPLPLAGSWIPIDVGRQGVCAAEKPPKPEPRGGLNNTVSNPRVPDSAHETMRASFRGARRVMASIVQSSI
jgi:hypothetical protein